MPPAPMAESMRYGPRDVPASRLTWVGVRIILLGSSNRPCHLARGRFGRGTWHQFRHIHSPLLNDLKVPVKIAQEQLAHASISTTLTREVLLRLGLNVRARFRRRNSAFTRERRTSQ